MQISQHDSLREVLTVSSRGQITLPAEMRKHLGIEPGDAVIVEDFGGELRLKPADTQAPASATAIFLLH